MFSAYSVANAFIERALAGRLHGLNSMKLQKLMYFAQAWHLKGTGRPLFEDTFLRGLHGPVLPFHAQPREDAEPRAKAAPLPAVELPPPRVRAP